MLSLITSMIAGIGRRHLDLWRDTGGVAAIVMAIFLPVLVGIAALTIDMSYAYWTRTQLQHAASAAALAGAGTLVDKGPADDIPDTDTYRDSAVEYAYKNMAESRFGRVINSGCGDYDPVTNTISGSAECADVKAGNWDKDARTFTPWDNIDYDPIDMALDAVRVVTRTSMANGNPMHLFLGAAVGLAQTDIGTSAVAVLGGGDASEACLIALDPSAPKSLHVEGTADITSDRCGICVNSTDLDKALYMNGTSSIYVDLADIVVGGGYDTVGNVDLYPTPTTDAGANACTDPFAGEIPQDFADRFANDTCPAGAFQAPLDGDQDIKKGLHIDTKLKSRQTASTPFIKF